MEKQRQVNTELTEEFEDYTLELPNYYKLLNIERHASDAQIKAAYRSMSRRIHPDRNHQ